MAKTKLAVRVASLEEVPEPYRELYDQDEDGKAYHLPGVVDKARHDEFRDNNLALQRRVETLEAEVVKYKDIDPAKAREALGKLQALEDKKLLDAGQVEEFVKRQVDAARKPLEDRLAAAEERAKGLQADLERKTVDAQLLSAATGMGVQAGTDEFIVAKAKAAGWKMVEGRAQLLEKDGTPRMSQKNPSLPMEPDEWLEGFVKEHPYIAKPSAGGGADGGAAAQGAPASGEPMKVSRADFTAGKFIKEVAEGKAVVI